MRLRRYLPPTPRTPTRSPPVAREVFEWTPITLQVQSNLMYLTFFKRRSRASRDLSAKKTSNSLPLKLMKNNYKNLH